MGCDGQWPAPGAETLNPSVFLLTGRSDSPTNSKGILQSRPEDALTVVNFGSIFGSDIDSGEDE